MGRAVDMAAAEQDGAEKAMHEQVAEAGEEAQDAKTEGSMAAKGEVRALLDRIHLDWQKKHGPYKERVFIVVLVYIVFKRQIKHVFIKGPPPRLCQPRYSRK